eukprot:9048832-Pyramimonas_sp.AAC.1
MDSTPLPRLELMVPPLDMQCAHDSDPLSMRHTSSCHPHPVGTDSPCQPLQKFYARALLYTVTTCFQVGLSRACRNRSCALA